MRGEDRKQEAMFSYVSPEKWVSEIFTFVGAAYNLYRLQKLEADGWHEKAGSD